MSNSPNNEYIAQSIKSIASELRDAESVLFITGAGISAESGIPTYRGVGGLYNVGTTPEGFEIEEILSASMLASDPALCWKYLAQIGLAVQGAKHNRAHELITEIESSLPRVWTLTQNVDGFHRSAGTQNLIEAHGNMHSLRCMSCEYSATLEQFEGIELPPLCPECSAFLRPNVVLFGELIDGEGIERLQRELEEGFDIVFSIGTSSMFPYIQAPIYFARQHGKPSVEINPSSTEISSVVNYYLPLPASEALTRIWQEANL